MTLEELLNEFFNYEFNNAKNAKSMKKILNEDLHCGENECVLKLVVPGYGKEDFNISVEGNELKIVVIDKYQKVYTLGEGIDVAAITAQCVNGILTITLPKKVEVKNVIKVEVK